MRLIIASLTAAVIVFIACNENTGIKKAQADDIATIRNMEKEELVARGRYLVTVAGCGDCHSPKILTPHGPEIDTTRILSGHPANSPLPPLNATATQPGQWASMSPDITAFAGPWGISFAANLTPDSATGIGAWSEEIFIKTLRTGKHLGADNGRPILPPMPWPFTGQMTDQDLSAVYAYLRSLPPINNRVPAPIPPNEVKTVSK